MLKLWNKAKDVQLDLLDAAPVPVAPTADAKPPIAITSRVVPSAPQLLPLATLCEDPANPRTEFPEAELDELAEDIRQHGILQPIVVHPADEQGQYRIHFGAKRWRAAQRAGLTEVPVVVRDAPTDPYTQVAENQKRHGLTPLDMAHFIKGRVDAGASNAEIAKRLGMNLTTVAHHLALLELPTELDQALKSGRCTSPRTLHELSKLHEDNPNQVQELLASGSEITRTSVSALRAAADDGASGSEASSPADKLIAQAHAACDRLERAIRRIRPGSTYKVALPELIALRIRVEDLPKHWPQGSDRQTP
ncbi:MAG: ParB/RepB/Spo0J family partition protein [Aquincola sp.]|nr:ParB/RepB/Spo0J family partition protein [Aquincola sp.]